MILSTDQESLQRIPSGRILGIDYGQKRVGLAISDPGQFLASTCDTMVHTNLSSLTQKILSIIKKNTVIAVVIGKPLHLKGEMSDMGKKTQRFAEYLEAASRLPTFFWDERWTTVSAEKLMIEKGLSPSRHRDKVDQVAAAFLLQSFLDRLSYIKRNMKEHEYL